MTDEALNTELGQFHIREGRGWMRRGDVIIECGELVDETVQVTVVSPHREADDLHPAYLAVEDDELDPHSVPLLLKLLAFASNVAEQINEANKEAIQNQLREEAEREQLAAEERTRVEALVEERKQMLLHELMGETVRVRHHSYRTTAKATVESRELRYEGETEDAKWAPRLRWHQAGNYNRNREDVQNWVLLDLKTDRGWRNVWDDGNSDIGGTVGAPARANVKPWSGGGF